MRSRGSRTRFWWPASSAVLSAIFVLACSGGSATPATPAIKTPLPAGGATPATTAGVPATAPAATAPAATATAAPASGGGDLGGTVASIADLAKALGPGDFAAAGVTGAGKGSVNSNEPGTVYVVYAGRSSATGGIEFDAFVVDTADYAKDTYDTVREGMPDAEGLGKKDLPGADEAAIRLDNPMEIGGTFASVAVRKGRLVFDIGIPINAGAEAQLTALAKLVLQRTVAVQ